jgi:hypothetical protein
MKHRFIDAFNSSHSQPRSLRSYDGNKTTPSMTLQITLPPCQLNKTSEIQEPKSSNQKDKRADKKRA